MRRAALVLFALAAPAVASLGCTDPCSGAAPTYWQKLAAKVGAAIAGAVSLTPDAPQPAQDTCGAAPSYSSQALDPEEDAGTCTVDTGDGACVACLKTWCCAESEACGAACVAAGSGEAFDAATSWDRPLRRAVPGGAVIRAAAVLLALACTALLGCRPAAQPAPTCDVAPGDSPCAACLKTSCCTAALVCYGHPFESDACAPMTLCGVQRCTEQCRNAGK